MIDFKISLDTKNLENQLKQQLQDVQRKAKQEALKQQRIEIARNLVKKQQIIGGIKMLDKTSEVVLEALLKMSEECNSLEFNANYDELPDGYADGLTQILENLQAYGLVFRHAEFIGEGFGVILSPQAKNYFHDKEEALRKEQEKQPAQNINITATGSNINFGSITNSTLSAENIVSNLEKEIEEKGGDDKEALKELLDEVKELCEGFQVNNPLPKRKKLMEKLSNHMSKHGWFYGEIVGLIGSAAMSAMM